MLVVHSVWAGDGLAFWAEDAAVDPRPASGAVPRAHPFAAPARTLTAALLARDAAQGPVQDPSRSSGEGGSDGEFARTLELLLPGSVKEPLPSPETGRLSAIARPRLHLWRVDALVPPVAEALRLVDEQATSATVRHWAAVVAFARDLVRRGRVIPQLVTAELSVAVWQPVLTGADASYFKELALAMPPACRTWSAERPSGEVQGAALGVFTDALVRAALGEPLVKRPGTPRERWLAALTGPDGTCPDVPELREELETWRTSVTAADGAARVCFRLVEPATSPLDADTGADPSADVHTDGDGWRVELALQAADDPGLYVPAGRVWGGGPVAGLPRRPERELLAGLGRAVRLYPELDRALREAEPSELTLDTRGAFEFLRQAAPLLQAAGFGVQLPRWAGRTRLGLKLTTRTKAQTAATSQGFGMRELVDFRVDLAVGEETITEEELAELARLKVPLVRVRGQWVELDERQLAAALKAVEGGRAGQAPAADILREVMQGDDELPLLAVDADGVLGDLLSGEAERRLLPIGTPAGLDATLRPYQERGLAWLSFLSELGLGGVLADDMGLGKTVTTLALLVHERADTPTLLVCPMSLVGNWRREAARFAPELRVHVHHGSGRDVGEIDGADLVITTYGTAQRDLEALRGLRWRRVVCDEAQAIKNSSTLQAQAVRAIPAGTRLALTGTPVENHLAELWSIMEFANPGLLGSRARFRTRFQEPIEARQDEQAARALRRATGPFVLRRLKTDTTIISDLPEKLEVKEWCPLTTEQASLYQAVVDDMLAKIDDSEGIERRGLVLSAMARLKQVCNHPAHLLKDGSLLAGRSGKLSRLEQLAEEIVAEGEKALVFTQYAEFGTMLQPYLAQRLARPVLWLHGGLPARTRDRLVERFQQDDEPMLFLLSLKAAGVGLNLTAANHVIHVDRWWNPAVEDQATDRAFRIGQRKNVQVRKLICGGTLEERVDEMIERKKALAERVVGAGEDWLTDLSTGELREVFRLTAEAVS
ncbi:DEAD/DEAH box helicase [Nonomuraea glycinis]|uniref:Helicase HelZ n=1 Tax=Nonomuraea glycinis TaxID=2047744 RepID=A0A918AGU6_9ACTN|nr:DEAD/DEAH box helicase [Nonomuraea glycinis]MCA2179709.1 DEAD/DEAH box helicase [Nonomuraea glycinis]GGP16437.1 helicase HelZ [Nonomuraea glycinis]